MEAKNLDPEQRAFLLSGILNKRNEDRQFLADINGAKTVEEGEEKSKTKNKKLKLYDDYIPNNEYKDMRDKLKE